MVKLTPVTSFRTTNGKGRWWCKREDLAAFTTPDYPSGSKVRQYAAMAVKRLPMLVGCSAESAMQIYIAAAARQAGVPGIIYTAQRAKRTEATKYAIDMGAQVIEVPHGYLSVVRAEARKRGEKLGKFIHWDKDLAITDAALQCANIPKGVKRIIVPTGSGLTAAGILVGAPVGVTVVIVAVSQMASRNEITALAKALRKGKLPQITFIKPTSAYGKAVIAALPDGTPLDPFYGAKALRYVKPGDLLWPPGLRPVSAMPAACQRAFDGWYKNTIEIAAKHPGLFTNG